MRDTRSTRPGGTTPTIHEDPLTTPAEAVDRPDEHPAAPPAKPESLAHGLFRLARPRQWVKNLLVFVAPGAAGVLLHGTVLWHAAAAFGIFCLAASGTYYLNDARRRRSRPQPSDQALPPGGGRRGAGPPGPGPRASSCSPPRSGLAAWLAGWHLSVVMGAYVGRPAGLLLGTQERAHPRPGLRQRRVHPPGRGRWRGHLGDPVQLVPHRGLLRLAPRRDGQALGREAAAGRGRHRPRRRPPDPRPLHPVVPALRPHPVGRGHGQRLLPVGLRAGQPGPPRPRPDLVPADHHPLRHRPAPRAPPARLRRRRRPRGAGPAATTGCRSTGCAGWPCSPSGPTPDEPAPVPTGAADRLGPHRGDVGRRRPRRPPGRRRPGHGRLGRRPLRWAAAGGAWWPGAWAAATATPPRTPAAPCSTPPGSTPSTRSTSDTGRSPWAPASACRP